MKDIYILAIETSCDETSIAIVKNGHEVVAMTILTQMYTHANFGGVVPEIASRKHIEKTYRVQIDIDITEEMKEKFKQGIVLKDHVCCPATIVVENKNTALITITEGKYHQIKRMFGCFGAKVVRLHRISMGGLQLPSDLIEGKCRELTAEELEKVCTRDK